MEGKMCFRGVLVEAKELEKIARQRKRNYYQITVAQEERSKYEKNGWKFIKPLRKKELLRKEKDLDELLEDEVWILFKNMGFAEMNKDRNFKLQAGSVWKQVDMFAKEGNNVFIVECKTSVKDTQISRKDIHEISDIQRDIINSIRKKYSSNIRVSFAIVSRGVQWNRTLEELAKEKGIFIWKEAELQYFNDLAKHLGGSAKYQLYSMLFRDKEAFEVGDIEIPAICGGRGRAKYYSFIIQPEKLLKAAYIHHRRSTTEELIGTYQRMLQKGRLAKIDRFISKGGYFPNNIILNFTKKPGFDKKAQVGDIVYGILKFPPYYASAWVIDGQHRLYGYANNEKRFKDTVSVLAFDSLNVKEQAKLFVEINKEQKAVTSNLLWDLYPDIYHDSEEDKLLCAVSLLTKKLNTDADSILKNRINIPSLPSKGKNYTNLTMATLCETIKETKLINREEKLLYEKDYEYTVTFAGERLKAYFATVAELFPEDWQKGDSGVLRTNIGVRILLINFRQLLRYLNYHGQGGIYKKKDLEPFKAKVRKLFSPVIEKLQEMSEEERNGIRKATAKGLVLNNAQQFAWWIKEKNDAFGIEILKNWAPPTPEDENDEHIKSLLGDTQVDLRSFIAKELKNLHGENWWREGIPKDIRSYINDLINDEIKKQPWKKEELFNYPLEKKLNYATAGHMQEVVRYGSNWERFSELFVKDKEYTLAQFKSFESLRNIYDHHREHECDEITKKLGYWAMRWIRKCAGFEEKKI